MPWLRESAASSSEPKKATPSTAPMSRFYKEPTVAYCCPPKAIPPQQTSTSFCECLVSSVLDSAKELSTIETGKKKKKKVQIWQPASHTNPTHSTDPKGSQTLIFQAL